MSGIETGKVAKVSGWKDVGMRALKVAVFVFLSGFSADVFLSLDLNVAQEAVKAAIGAGLSVVVNAVLAWSSA